MHIGSYRKHKLTARPLRNLESVLKHRVHVESRWVHSRLPAGVWKFEACNYIDVADPAFAACFVLNQISGMSEWFSGLGYRPVISPSGEIDDDTICTFYWHDDDGPGAYRHIRSGGVLLTLVKKSPLHRYGDARPIVRPLMGVPKRNSFRVKMVLHFSCTDRQKLIQHHWPKLMEKYAFNQDDRVEFGLQPIGDEPSEITVWKTLVGVSQHEAIAYCLARTERCRFKLGGSGKSIFEAERFPGRSTDDGMYSISLTREE